ncbi:MAG: hypothetical protein J6N95_01175 [Bacilli bacterium]|nr:hypothetical protein [Bacilli bacterium]
MNRIYVNTKETFYTKIEDFPQEKVGKLLNKFFYYKCECCNEIKEKRIYSEKRQLKVDFICRECKYKETSLQRYGTTNPTSKSIEKRNKTMLEKYGTLSTSQFIDYSKIDYAARNEKSKKTNIEKYGVDNVAKSKEVQDKIKKTNIEKYGGIAPACNNEIKDKQRKTILEKYGSYSNMPGPKACHNKFIKYRSELSDSLDLEWLDESSFRGKYDNGPIYYTFKCNKCGKIFKDDFHSGLPICRNCNPTLNGSSNQEESIYCFIKSVYSGEVIRHDRKVLEGKELDFYFPDLKVAIEYNGTYWHGYRKDTTIPLSEFKKKVEEKRLICESKNIRLITIDEADYMDRPAVYNRFIQDTICPRKRVFARKCVVKEIDTDTAREFCEYYHVNGFKGGYKKLGLFYNNELLIVAIFGKHPKYENECIRLVYKTGYDVIGGWAKITKHFGKKFLHYVNLKYFRGENKTGCGYRFYIKKRLVYRQQVQKKYLNNYCNVIDKHLSDFQNCLLNNGIAIFDVGNDIRIYNE